MTWEYKLAVALIHVEKFVESTPGSLMDSPESLTTEGSLKEDMSVILDGRESPDVPSSTSDSRDTIEVVNHDDSDLKSDSGGGGRHSINNSPGKIAAITGQLDPLMRSQPQKILFFRKGVTVRSYVTSFVIWRLRICGTNSMI